MFTTPYLSQQPVDDFGLRFSGLLYSSTLSATTDTTLTVPGNAPNYKALIKVSKETWVALNHTAAVPAGNTFASTTSELINTYQAICREVKAGDVLHFFAPAGSTDVSVIFYALGTNN